MSWSIFASELYQQHLMKPDFMFSQQCCWGPSLHRCYIVSVGKQYCCFKGL